MTAQVLHARPTYSLPEANVGTLRALISGGRKEGGGGGEHLVCKHLPCSRLSDSEGERRKKKQRERGDIWYANTYVACSRLSDSEGEGKLERAKKEKTTREGGGAREGAEGKPFLNGPVLVYQLLV